MRLFKISFIILIVLSCVLLIISCGKSDKNKEELEEIESIFEHIAKESELANTETETETQIETQTDVGEHLYVVIPERSSSALSTKAQKLVDGLAEQTGLLVTLKYDNVHESSPTGTCEILIGNTNRLESQNAAVLLKENEYLCRWDTGKIVICGGSDEASVDSLERFIIEVLPRATRYLLMDKDGGFESIGETSVNENETDAPNETEGESVALISTINGYNINEFSIVYDVADKYGEKYMAEMLRQLIKKRSGYLLDLVSSDKVGDKVSKTITLSVADTDESGIESHNGSVALKAANSYTLSLAVAEFIEDINECTKDGIITLSYDKKINISKTSAKIDIMTYFVKKLDDAQALIELLDALALGKQDVYIVANVNEKLFDEMSRNLPQYYNIYKVNDFSCEIAIVYNFNTVEDISADVIDGCMDVNIELSDGESLRYCYFLDADGELAEELLSNSSSKTMCFFEDIDSSKTFSMKIVASGNSTLNSKNVDYKLIIGDFLCENNGSVTVKNTSLKLSCAARIAINISDKLLKLNNSLE